MIATYTDGVYVWDTSVEAALDHACALAARNFTAGESATFFPGQPYQETCTPAQLAPDEPGRKVVAAILVGAVPFSLLTSPVAKSRPHRHALAGATVAVVGTSLLAPPGRGRPLAIGCPRDHRRHARVSTGYPRASVTAGETGTSPGR